MDGDSDDYSEGSGVRGGDVGAEGASHDGSDGDTTSQSYDSSEEYTSDSSESSSNDDIERSALRLRANLFRWTCVVCLETQPIRFFPAEISGEDRTKNAKNSQQNIFCEWKPLSDEAMDYCRALDRRRKVVAAVDRVRNAFAEAVEVFAQVSKDRSDCAAAVLNAINNVAAPAVASQGSGGGFDIEIDAKMVSAKGAKVHAHAHATGSRDGATVEIQSDNTTNTVWNAEIQQHIARLQHLDASVAEELLQACPYLLEAAPPALTELGFELPALDLEPPTLPESLFRAQICANSACGTPYVKPSASALVAPSDVEGTAVLFEEEGSHGTHHHNSRAYHSIPINQASSPTFNANDDICAATLRVVKGKRLCGPAGTRAHMLRHGITADSLSAQLSSSDEVAHLPGMIPKVVISYDDRMLLHEEAKADARVTWARMLGVHRLPFSPPAYHPERPDRLRAIAQHLIATGVFQRCQRLAARECHRHELEGVHDKDYLDAIDNLNEVVAAHGGNYHFGSDTYACINTLMAAKLSCGSTLAVTEEVARGGADRGVALVRPPGHHAEPDTAMGFCIYNNVAIAAWCAIHLWGLSRVLVVDWDVHHGNGTENMFYNDPSIMYISLHRYDAGSFYPGTGSATRVGDGKGAGYNINVPWPKGGMGDAEYMAAFNELIMPLARLFNPQLVMISSGFDAARGDPLGGCDLTPLGYAHMTQQLLSLASGRTVVVLEGGYNLRSISRSMEAVVRVLLGETPPPLFVPPKRTHASEFAENGETKEDHIQSVIDGALAFERKLARHLGGNGYAPEMTAPTSHGAHQECVASIFAACDDDDEELEEEYKDADRDDILAAMAPRYDALLAIWESLHALSPYWPPLAIKLAAVSSALTSAQSESLPSSHDSDGGSASEEPEAKRPRKNSPVAN